MLLALLLPAFAEESTFAGAKGPTIVPTTPGAHATAELGGALTFGNTETMALTGLGNVDYRWRKNGISGTFGVNWGQSKIDADGDGKLNDDERAEGYVKTAERELVTLRYDRFFGKRDSLYALGGAFTDSFAGYDFRVNGQVGWSHAFVDQKGTTFKGELGLDIARENFVDGVEPNAQTVIAARILLGLRHEFNEHVAFEDTLEAYEGLLDFTDFRLNNTAAVIASMTTRLSLKLSHQLAFDNVPVEGYQPLDHTTMATVVVTFL